MKKVISIIFTIGLILGVATACSQETKQGSANAKEQEAQAVGQQDLLNSQPIPQFTWSQIRQTAIDIQTAQAQTTQTTTFFFNQGVVDPVFVCPSIGFPVASTSQLSNPSQITSARVQGNSGHHYAEGVINQIDPNGIYSGDSTGTYVLCVGADGKAFGKYFEGFVDTVTGPAHWDSAKHQEVMDGSSSFSFTTK